MATAEDDGGPVIGMTGARFGGARRARRAAAARDGKRGAAVPGHRSVEPGPDDGDPAPWSDDGDPAIGMTGARFGGARRTRERRAAARVPPPRAELPAPAETAAVPEPDPAEITLPGIAPAETAVTVRPYVLTGGRTRAAVGFAIEALVSDVPGGPPPGSPEQARIRELCAAPRSVAEIAALLGVPLGVAQVLVADLLAVGAVTVHRTVAAGGPDLALLERVLSGLHRL